LFIEKFEFQKTCRKFSNTSQFVLCVNVNPQEMKAIVIQKFGSPEVMEYSDVEVPKIKDDEVLVENYASSVNPVDWKIRNGMLRWIAGNSFPKILGGDIAGRVVEIGHNVQFLRVGDEVYGLLNVMKGGAYAEYVAAPQECFALKPQSLDFEQAATIPLAALTALQALRDQGKIMKGQEVLINGCSGGVGSFALQIARAFETHVTGVCSTRNIDVAMDLGAHRVIDYSREDLLKSGEKYHIFFDAVGNQSYFQIRHLLHSNGIFVTTLPTIKIMLMEPFHNLFSSRKIKKVMVRYSRKDLEFLSELVDQGKLRTRIDKEFKLEEIRQAHEYSETGRVVGKILIKVKP
jgi:NADPH:quinone reductase-like Zn-dependent oxidoreductase